LVRAVVELPLDAPGPVHAGAAPDQLDPAPRHEPQEVARLETDLLHAEVARRLVGDPAEPAAELTRELPLAVEPHQVLGEVEDAARDALRRRAGDQPRVVLLEHPAAARPRDDDVVALVDERPERGQVPARAAPRRRPVPP